MMECVISPLAGLIFILVCIIYWFFNSLTIDDYENRYVLITGCDTGFGNMLAKRLTSMGFNVFAGCFTEKGILDLQQVGNQKLKPFLLDVTKKESIDKAKKFVKEHLPNDKGLWALVNNAGILGPLSFIDCYNREHYEKILDVNLYGTIEMSMAFLPLLRKAEGRIVNVASVAGFVTLPTCIPYCISKYAVESFSDGLRRTLSGQNVSVHMLEPGLHATPLLEEKQIKDGMYKNFKSAPQEVQDYYGEKCFESYSWHVCKSSSLISSPRTHKVVNAHVHAVTARFPKRRYLIGYDAHMLFWPLYLMPGWMSDVILKIRYIEPIQQLKKKID